MALLARQQKVNEILSEEIAQIHALQMKTWTAAQWETKKDQYS
jgi:acid stress-induced BolA-like protein IbaG/YrbA